MANLQDIEQSIDLYMVEETDAWHSRNSATPMGLYHSKEDSISPFDTVKGSFTQCIPFNDDTKHLLGTTDPCDEMYINW